jgi:hypothetical protein
VLAVLMFGGTAFGQLVTYDNFNYTDFSKLTDNGWVAHSGAGTAPINVGASNGLTYTGYSGLTGITGVVEGNAARVDSNGEDDSKIFTAVTSGTLYSSFLLNVPSSTTGYFLNLGGSSSLFAARFFVKPSATPGKINFGISNTSTAVYAAVPTDYDLSTTYLVIIKYDVSTTGAVSFWVKASGVPGTEVDAGTPEVSTSGTGQASIDRICLRQYSATQSQIVDGIRIGMSWFSILGLPGDALSDIVAAGNETSNIDYASYQNSSITLTTDALRVWSFTVRDGGGIADGDAYPTILSGITFNKGTNNGVTNWANTIRQAALFNGSNKVAEVSVTGETIVFSGMSGADVTALDDASTTLDLYVTFESTVTDNQQFEFQVTNTNVTAGSPSSTFAAFTAQLSSVTSDANRLEVTATKLAFSTQPPTSVAQNNDFSAAVEARDANENVDADYATNFGLSLATGTGTLSSVAGLSQAPTSGAVSWSDLRYNTPETGVSILAQSGSLTSATSNTFDVTGASAASDVVAGVLTIPNEISSLDDTQGEEVALFDFTIRDGGGAADPDLYATIVTGLSVVPATLNDISDWSTYIQGAELYDGITLVGTGTVSAASIAFSGAPLVSVADGGSATLTLKLWLMNPMPVGADAKMFQAKINQNTDVTVDPLGSMMAAGGTDVVGGTGTEVSVDATELRFVGTIPNKNVNTNFAATAIAVDVNGNIDEDFVTAVTFAKGSGPGNLTGTTSPLAVAGTATTTDLQFDAGGIYTLDASGFGVSNATSNSFTIASPAVFKAAAGADTLWWDYPASWVIESGYSLTGTPHSKDEVILDHTYHAGKYVMSVGPTLSDSAAKITIGYPTNPDSIFLLIPSNSSASIASLVYGNAVIGDYDLIIAENGAVWDSKLSYSKSCLYRGVGDSVWIRTGGLWYHNTNGFNTMLKFMSRRTDGDLGTVEFDVPTVPGMTFDMSGGNFYWYPNVVFSNRYNAPTYWWYGSGPTYIQGNLTINAGAKDSMSTGGTFFIRGNIINNGIQMSTTSPIAFNGSTPQTVSGVISCGAGFVPLNPAGVSFLNDVNLTGGTTITGGDFTYDIGGGVFTTVPAQGVVTTGANTVYLNPSGSLTEGDSPIQGNVSATRTANLGSNELFGNIGIGINGIADAPGVTTVARKTGVVSTGNGNESVKRYFDITPTVNTGLNATVLFDYATSELNGIDENTLMLFKSEDAGTTWSGKAGSVNAPMNRITATGVNSFSRWTAGSYNTPLFVAHTITVMKIEDTDGDLNTTTDQVAKKWRLNLYLGETLLNSQNLNSGVMVTPNLEEGTYTATENDSIGWLHLGVRVNGVLTTGSMNSAEVTVAGGLPGEVIFYNQKASSLTAKKYRDYDGDAGTTADQVAIEWGLSIYKDVISEGTLVTSTTTGDIAINDIQAGTYFVVEENKGTAWKRINGNLGLIDTVIVAGGDDAVVTFVNFKPNSLTIRKMKDGDGKIATFGDRIAAMWHMEVHKDSAAGALVASTEDGTLNLADLGDGNYTIIESDSANWIHLGYALNGSNHASIENKYTVGLFDGMNTTFDFVNAPPIYSNMYRSFDPDSIANSKDLKLKYKYLARKANANEFEFELTAPQSVTLLLKFSMASSGVVLNGVDTVGTWTNVKTVTTTAVDSGDVVHVYGWGYKGSLVKTGYEWATLPKKTKGNVLTYLMNQPRLPMPNRLNAIYDAFALTGFPTGLQVGMDKSIPDSTKLYGWLNSPKPGDVAKTLNYKGTHTALAHGFDAWTTSGKPFLKRQKSIASAKYNNILLAQMISLKLNIAASSMEMIPLGFGELIYDDASLVPPTVDAPVLNGMMVKEIASLVDSMMMGWAHVDTVIKTKPQYSRHFHDPAIMAYLNTAVTKINNAFEGQLDTTSFASSLVFTGVKKLIDVDYLKGNSSVVPAKIIPDYTKLEQIPESYKLHQNYPNPFNPTTMIQFDLPEEAFVTLKVYNLLGQEVATLLNNELLTEGTQEVEFSASSFASGVYFYRLSAEGIGEEGTTSNTFNSVHKMILMK